MAASTPSSSSSSSFRGNPGGMAMGTPSSLPPLRRLLAALVLHVLVLAARGGGPPPTSCGPSSPPQTRALPFCNKGLPAAQRAADLVSRLTQAEKASQLADVAPAVPRLGVPGYKWWNEALHGVAISGRGIHLDQGAVRSATSFPQVLLTAAAFNDNLWFRIGQATGREARALYNIGQAEGLTMWSPVVNIFRDPRWGRGQESPGEDPAVASRYAAAFVWGLQGSGFGSRSAPAALLTSACCKHATAYDLEDWKGVSRYSFVAKVTPQDLADTFNPPFRSCAVDGRANCLMCAYTNVNGVPSCANPDLLTKTFRASWGLDGYVAADCDAIAIMRNSQFYRPTPEDTVATAIKAGLDIDCGPYVTQYAMSAIQKGKLSPQDVDRALKSLFTTRMRLGHFDGDYPKGHPYGNLGAAHICTPEHKALALEAALDGIVLLKNEPGVLPLRRGAVASAAVIGHNANDGIGLLGNYWGPPCWPMATTPLVGIQGFVKSVKFVQGCNSAACNAATVPQATAAASSSDAVFLFMGLSQQQESEGKDRTTLLLPGQQQALITAVAGAAKRPVILVLITGGPVDVTFAQANPKIGAILWAGYPGQAGGLAIAKILFGEKNPSGKLPVTWYPEEFTRIPMTDMRMRADPATGYPGRSYRFYKGKTIYKFGHGLSYSKFSQRLLTGTRNPAHNTSLSLAGGATAMTEDEASYHVDGIGEEVCEQLKFPAVVAVKNHGPMDGKHTALMFLRWPNATEGRPERQLVGFRSEHIRAGEKASLRFEVSPCEHFSRVWEDGTKVIDKGSHFLMVGKHEVEIGFGV